MKNKNTTKRTSKKTPKKVFNPTYYEQDCAIYGKCPDCGSIVVDAIWGTDKECSKCGQPLIW